jgi:UDP-sugar transporter A1/2/3
MFSREQLPYTASAAFLMCLQPILVTMSKEDNGSFAYSVPVSTMLSEALKLAISSTLLFAGKSSGTIGSVLHDESLSEFASYLLPAGIYFVNNNCIFFILQAVDPTTFQLLSQMKTIFTGLLFRVFLQRKLSAVQYLALITLACGTACSQLPSPHKHHRPGAAPFFGAMLSVLSSLLSALGGIYNEKLLKGRPSASIHWQNIQMYVWGVAFNGIGAYAKDGAAFHSTGLLAGFDSPAWAVVGCNALNGLAISAVLKYADNIARVYAHAIAMMLTMGISTQFFGAPVTPQLVLAVTLVFTSTLQYNLPKDLLRDPEEEEEARGLMGSSAIADGSDKSDSEPHEPAGGGMHSRAKLLHSAA